MKKITIYDHLDLTRASHAKRVKGEVVSFSAAHLILWLLRGWSPIISQTQAFDSRTILGAALDGSQHGYSFRWLVKNRHIRIALYKKASLIDAFMAALDDKDFIFLSWPELNGPSPLVDRSAVKSALLNSKAPSELPGEVLRLIETLKALDDDLKAAGPDYALEPTLSLSTLLADAHSRSYIIRPDLYPILKRLLDKKSDKWSVHFAEINKMDINDNLKASALDVLDTCYNQVLANSLGASLISQRTVCTEPIQILRQAVASSDAFTMHVSYDPPDSKNFAKVGWEEIKHHLHSMEGSSELEISRHALASKLVASAIMNDSSWIALAPKAISMIWTAGSASWPVLISSEMDTASLFALAFSNLLLSQLMTDKISGFFSDQRSNRLERKYFGIIHKGR